MIAFPRVARVRPRTAPFLSRIAFASLLVLGPARALIAGEPAPPSNVVTVVRQDVFHVLPVVGTLMAAQTTRIGSQVSGRVKEVLVDVGDTVRKDQPLVKLDSAFFDIEVKLRRAELKAVRTQIDQAKQRWDRLERLWNNGVDPATTEQLKDDARYAFDLTQSQSEQAAQALSMAEERLKESTICAPYDGLITQRLVDPGEPVTSAPITLLLEIQAIDTLELHFTLPQENLELAKAGTPVQYQVNGVPGLGGVVTIERIFPAMDEATRSIRCRALIENTDRRLQPSLLMEVGVVVAEAKGVLALPRAAVYSTPRGSAVRVPKDAGYEERLVKTGLSGLSTIEILEGLNEGDAVFATQAAASARQGATS
ncbi:MAG: efflux RND transporter periplasmic adaptor subunit [Candidatus Hydrogenedentes bacterium]|nr:efflux RND transporter periplasmic adaptor subunit [Candidatus Hydrogenedentota bacterium]